MRFRSLLIALGVLFVGLLIVGFSPLVEGESGWKNTLGDIIWTGIFLTALALVVVGVLATSSGVAHAGPSPKTSTD